MTRPAGIARAPAALSLACAAAAALALATTAGRAWGADTSLRDRVDEVIEDAPGKGAAAWKALVAAGAKSGPALVEGLERTSPGDPARERLVAVAKEIGDPTAGKVLRAAAVTPGDVDAIVELLHRLKADDLKLVLTLPDAGAAIEGLAARPEGRALLGRLVRVGAGAWKSLAKDVAAARPRASGAFATFLEEVETIGKGGEPTGWPEGPRRPKGSHGKPVEDAATALASADPEARPVPGDELYLRYQALAEAVARGGKDAKKARGVLVAKAPASADAILEVARGLPGGGAARERLVELAAAMKGPARLETLRALARLPGEAGDAVVLLAESGETSDRLAALGPLRPRFEARLAALVTIKKAHGRLRKMADAFARDWASLSGPLAGARAGGGAAMAAFLDAVQARAEGRKSPWPAAPAK